MKDRWFTGLFAAFAVGTLVAVPLRVFELLFAIDESGFYIGGSGVVPVLNVLLVVLIALLLLPFFFRRLPSPFRWSSRSKATGILAFVVAAAFIGDNFWRFYSVLDKTSFDAGFAFGNFLIAVTALLSAVYFLRLGAGAFSNAEHRYPATALFPILWGVLVLAVSFMQYTTIANISEQLFDVLKMVFLLLFFYYHARVTGNMPNDKEARGLESFGLLAVLFVFMTVPPRLIARLLGPKHGSFPNAEGVLDLILAIYILDVVLAGAARARSRRGPDAAKPGGQPFIDYEARAKAGNHPELSAGADGDPRGSSGSPASPADGESAPPVPSSADGPKDKP